MRAFSLSRASLYLTFLTFCLLTSGIFVELDAVGSAPLLLFFGLTLYLSAKPPKSLTQVCPISVSLPKNRVSIENICIGTFIAAPVLLYFALTFCQEFPFAGDQPFHLQMARAVAQFWLIRSVPVLLLCYLCYKVSQKTGTRLGFLLLFSLFLAWSFLEASHIYFSRYPAAGYFIHSPVVVLFRALFSHGGVSSNRFTNVLSLFGWLFLLRPLIIRRWPDRTILPFGVFFFFQQIHVYYFSSYYLEPWCVTLFLIVVEGFIRLEEKEWWKLILLTGFCAVIKEQAVLALPFMWFISEWKEIRKGKVLSSAILGVVAVVPFFLYNSYRKKMEIWRSWNLVPTQEILSGTFFSEFYRHLEFQFGKLGLLLVGIVIFVQIYFTLFGKKRRLIHAVFFFAGLFQVLFFYVDGVSRDYPAYPRFHLLTLAFWGAGFIELAIRWEKKKYAAILLAVGILGLHLQTLAPAFLLTKQKDSTRNYIDHFDAPQFFPIRTLYKKAAQTEGFAQVDALLLQKPAYVDFWPYYPEMGKKFRFVDRKESQPCTCVPPSQGVLLVPLYYTGLNSHKNVPAGEKEKEDSCLKEMQNSCAHLFVEQMGAATLGAIGY